MVEERFVAMEVSMDGYIPGGTECSERSVVFPGQGNISRVRRDVNCYCVQ